MQTTTGYIPLFRLANDSIVCGPSVHRTEDCARNAQPILSPFALLAVDVPTASDAPVVDLDDWSAAVRAQVSSVCIGFLQFQARPKAERDASSAAPVVVARGDTAGIVEAAAERAARAYHEWCDPGSWERLDGQMRSGTIECMKAALAEFAEALTSPALHAAAPTDG